MMTSTGTHHANSYILCRKRSNHNINVAYAYYESDMNNNTMNIIPVKSTYTVATLPTDDREYGI